MALIFTLTIWVMTNQLLGVSPRKATCLPKQFSAQKQSTTFKKLRIIYTKGNTFGSWYKKSFSFQEELQLNHIKHRQIPPQVLFATLTHDYQTKLELVHYLFEHETVLPSLKDDCYPGLADFRHDQFPIRKDNEREKNVIKTLDSFSFHAVQPIQVPFKKPTSKNAKLLIQRFFPDTDNEDPVGKRKPQDKIPYRSDLSLVHKVDYEEKTNTSLKIIPLPLKNLMTLKMKNYNWRLFIKQIHL